jgi:hypothetical protein
MTKIAEQLLVSLSDQQSVTVKKLSHTPFGKDGTNPSLKGIAISLTAHVRMCQLTSYHFQTSVLLAMVSVTLHGLAIRALLKYQREQVFSRLVKLLAMTFQMVLFMAGTVRTVGGGIGKVDGVRIADIR